MRENRGKDAADAEQHFSDFACEIGMSAADAFTGRFREHFIRDAEAAGLHLAEEGRAYAAQEQTAWRQKILADDKAQTLADIAAAPGDGNYIQERINNLKLRHVALFPKEDAQGVIDGLDREAAGAIVDGFLAQGRLEDARGALERHRDFLGERAAGYERKIASKGRQLAARRQADAKQARLEQEQNAVLGATGEILNGVQGFPSLETQRDEAFALAEAIAHPDMRGQVRTMLEQEFTRRAPRAVRPAGCGSGPRQGNERSADPPSRRSALHL